MFVMRSGVVVGLAVLLSAPGAEAQEAEPALARVPFLQDAGVAIDVSLLASATGHLDLARAAAARALQLAPGELDAHLAAALAHEAAGSTDLARAQASTCRSDLADRAGDCAAVDRVLGSGQAAGRLAFDAAVRRRTAPVAAPVDTRETQDTHPGQDEEDGYADRLARAYRAAADSCVGVSRWNHIYVRVEVGDSEGPPRQVDVFAWEKDDDDLRECLEASFRRTELPGRSYVNGQAHVGKVDFEETGKFHAEWFWRIRPTVQAYGLADTDGDRRLVVARGAMPLLDRPFLQPTAHLDAEIGSTHDGREYELVGRLGVGFARDPFAGGLTVGAGASEIGQSSPSALVVPVELWIDVRQRGAGLVAWARNTFSPAEERAEGAEHATLDATALQLGTGLRVPLLWRGGIMLGIRYDERLGEQRLGVWLGTEWRAARF